MHQQAGAGPPFRRFAPTLRPQMAALCNKGEMMSIIGLPLIYIAYRYWSFLKITPSEVSALTGDEREMMVVFSRNSLFILVGVLVLSLGVEFLYELSKQQPLVSNIPALIGIVVAVFFDQKAEALNRKGRAGSLANRDDRPASVLVSIIIFGLFALTGVVVLIQNHSSNILFLIGQLFLPTLPLVALVGLHLRKNWARIYSSVLIGSIGILYLIVGVLSLMKRQDQFVIGLSFSVFCLFCWWFYAIALGKRSKFYFLGSENA